MHPEVTLTQILLAREQRAQRQQDLLKRFGCPLICFTMNIPGPVKNSPLIRRSFRWGLETLERRIPHVLHRQVSEAVTGCEAYLVVEGTPEEIKQVCTRIEEETPLGRLFDMDVLTAAGHKLERSEPRSCFVCGASGRGCASRRLHSVEELTCAVQRIMATHFLKEDTCRIGDLAVESLLQEVSTTPKPGLVDRRNNGSHTDMDLHTFTASAQALRPYFRRCAALGRETAMQPPEETFRQLRQAGLLAEEDMYRATGGINTHKGAIFTLGLLCGSLGRLWQPTGEVSLDALLAECARLGRCCLKDFEDMTQPATAGERLYAARGFTGIRGEAAAGLPSVKSIGLPVFRQLLAAGYGENDAAALTLLHLIARVEDTNLYHRGGPEGAAWAKAAAEALLPNPAMGEIEALDDAFICRNLSPGGCADLLAVTIFLHKLTTQFAFSNKKS